MNKLINDHIKGFKKRQDIYPELFKLDNWRESDSYKLIRKWCFKEDAIIEIGCLTGHHLLLLEEEGYENLTGIDFVPDAIAWGKERTKKIKFYNEEYNMSLWERNTFDKIILFDILEHLPNIDVFLRKVQRDLKQDGEVLVLVPKGKEYFDPCHINFYPDCDCLTNLLQMYFTIDDIFEIDNKIFARCSNE